MQSIIQDQYYLASKAGIGILETNLMPDFERSTLIDLLAADIKAQNDSMKKT